MKRLRSILGYSWAALALPIVLATFFGMPGWAKALVGGTGLHVSPLYTGGEIRRTVRHEGYETRIHRPVFDGLLRERSKGFVQVDWAADSSAVLPDAIDETIDVEGDGAGDFRVLLDTRTDQATVQPLAPRVLGLERVYRLTQERTVRVRLRNER